MDCPSCDGLLEKLDFTGFEVDRCSSCRGIWFDSGEIESYVSSRIDKSASKLSLRFEPTYRSLFLHCPRCQSQTLNPGQAKGGRHLHRCSNCSGAFVPKRSLSSLDVALAPPSWTESVLRGLDAGASSNVLETIIQLIDGLFDEAC